MYYFEQLIHNQNAYIYIDMLNYRKRFTSCGVDRDINIILLLDDNQSLMDENL